jgi:uncharacterized protein YcfJ
VFNARTVNYPFTAFHDDPPIKALGEKFMNKNMMIGSVLGAVAVTTAGSWAGYQALDSSKYAEVISAKQAMKTVSTPREECRDEIVNQQRAVKDPQQIAGTVTGAVVGGLLGNQIGGGKGKKIATVGGAVAGGYAGNKIQEGMQERDTEQVVHQVCSMVYDKHEQKDGFNVIYRLDGREHSIHMKYDPGSKIPVKNGVVQIEPAR